MGSTVCTVRTDERKEVGGQEVENKRHMSDLSGCLDHMRRKDRKVGRRGRESHAGEAEASREAVRNGGGCEEDERSSGREEAVNAEKRLQRRAPGEAEKKKKKTAASLKQAPHEQL